MPGSCGQRRLMHPLPGAYARVFTGGNGRGRGVATVDAGRRQCTRSDDLDADQCDECRGGWCRVPRLFGGRGASASTTSPERHACPIRPSGIRPPAIVEHPRPIPSSLARDGPIADTHVRLGVPPASPHQRVIRKAPMGRRMVRPDLAVVARRPTVANLPSISSPTIPSPDADARTSSAPVRVRDERDGLIGA